MVEMSQQAGPPADGMPAMEVMDLAHDVVMGHEFAAEVIELGADVGNSKVGDVVVSMPLAFDAGRGALGRLQQRATPAATASCMVLNDLLSLTVPNGLAARRAALTEPMAVGLHAVNRSQITPGHAAVVLGAGPVGLAVDRGAARRWASSRSWLPTSRETRRRWPMTMGAHEVVDPGDRAGHRRLAAARGRRARW